jgi:hypothetical protein
LRDHAIPWESQPVRQSLAPKATSLRFTPGARTRR